MTPETARQFDLIEKQRAEIVEIFVRADAAALVWKPRGDGWSLLEIAEHLLRSDETLGRARDPRALLPEALPFRLLPRGLRRTLVLNAMRRDVALPLPSPDIAPGGALTLEEILTRWETVRAAMRAELDAPKPEEGCYSHPVLGPLTAAQMLTLSQVHTAYHRRQIDGLFLSAAAAPRR